MNDSELQRLIDDAWEARDRLSATTQGPVREAVEAALAALDDGRLRVAEKVEGEWRVNQWLKKAVLLSFRLNDMVEISGAPGGAQWWDKVDSKFKGWSANRFRAAGFRAVPGCVVRHSAHIARSGFESFRRHRERRDGSRRRAPGRCDGRRCPTGTGRDRGGLPLVQACPCGTRPFERNYCRGLAERTGKGPRLCGPS